VAGGSDAVAELFARGSNTSPVQNPTRQLRAISTAVRSLDDSGASRHYCWTYIEPDTWMIDINTRPRTGGRMALRVFYNFERGEAIVPSSTRIMEKEASSISAGSEGLVFHPISWGGCALLEHRSSRKLLGNHKQAHQSTFLTSDPGGDRLRSARCAFGNGEKRRAI
jgi:hypothetical protein